jgi:hypothetical protein
MISKRSYVAMMIVAALIVFSGSSEADNDDRFTERSLRGSWGFSAAGFLAVRATGSHTPASAVGLLTFDGRGECTDEAKLNSAGTVVSLTSITCTYTVNPDGTGTIQTTFAPAGAFTTDFVIIEEKGEFHFIVSDVAQPGTTVASGVARRQR